MQKLHLILAFVPLIFLQGCTQPNNSRPKGEKWEEIPLGPKGTLLFYAEATSDSGPHQVYMYQAKEGDTLLLGSTELNNDGAQLDGHNLDLHVLGPERVEFSFKGAKQEPEHWFWLRRTKEAADHVVRKE